MRTNNPRGNHYIPQMLLKRFCTPNGQLWVNNGFKVYPDNPQNAFKQRDLNATRNVIPSLSEQRYTVELTYEHEDTLSKIEGDAEPAIERIIEQTRGRRLPKLSPKQQDAWKKFYLAMDRRTPEAQVELWPAPAHEDAFYEEFQRFAEKEGIRIPEKEHLLQIGGIADQAKLIGQNTNAGFSAGNHTILQEKESHFIKSAGLIVAVISFSTKRFVIGSRGLAIVEDSHYRDLMKTSWLPVAPDVAIGATNNPDIETIVYFDNNRDGVRRIDAINHAMAARSWAIAGASKELVQSVSPGRIRQRPH